MILCNLTQPWWEQILGVSGVVACEGAGCGCDHYTLHGRAGANSGPELDLLVNSNSGIGIGIELAFPSLIGIGIASIGIGIELELP